MKSKSAISIFALAKLRSARAAGSSHLCSSCPWPRSPAEGYEPRAPGTNEIEMAIRRKEKGHGFYIRRQRLPGDEQSACADSARRRGRAIVMGGSMAGLAAARVLSDYYREVIVVERDRFAPLTTRDTVWTSAVPLTLECS